MTPCSCSDKLTFLNNRWVSGISNYWYSSDTELPSVIHLALHEVLRNKVGTNVNHPVQVQLERVEKKCYLYHTWVHGGILLQMGEK